MGKKVSIEKTALIVGTLLGVVSFFWQVYESVDKLKQKVGAEINFEIPIDGHSPINLIVTVTNYGQRPVYIKTIVIKSENLNFDDKWVYELVQYEKTQTDSIQPGQSREFKTTIFYQRLQDWFASENQIDLVIESPTQKIFEKNINRCIENASRMAKNLQESEDVILTIYPSVCIP